MKIGNRVFDTDNEVYVMGILNVTPDSFSDGGKFVKKDAALYRAEKMISEGATIIDVGGESTRPGSIGVSAEEELWRVLPVIRALRERFDTVISLDTFKPKVAEEGLKEGVSLINDIYGLIDGGKDSGMARVIADAGAACVIMHNTGRKDKRGGISDAPAGRGGRAGTDGMKYDNGKDRGYGTDPVSGKGIMDLVKSDLVKSLEIAEAAGIRKDGIILDPGIGFGKNTDENLSLMSDIGALTGLGCPVMLAASRKTVIGDVLGLGINDRLEGTIALTAAAVLKGCAFVRVHDVKENVRAARMALALRNHAKAYDYNAKSQTPRCACTKVED